MLATGVSLLFCDPFVSLFYWTGGKVRPVSSHPHVELIVSPVTQETSETCRGQFIQYVPLRTHIVLCVKFSEAFYLKSAFGILLDFNGHKEDEPIPFFLFLFF